MFPGSSIFRSFWIWFAFGVGPWLCPTSFIFNACCWWPWDGIGGFLEEQVLIIQGYALPRPSNIFYDGVLLWVHFCEGSLLPSSSTFKVARFVWLSGGRNLRYPAARIFETFCCRELGLKIGGFPVSFWFTYVMIFFLQGYAIPMPSNELVTKICCSGLLSAWLACFPIARSFEDSGILALGWPRLYPAASKPFVVGGLGVQKASCSGDQFFMMFDFLTSGLCLA